MTASLVLGGSANGTLPQEPEDSEECTQPLFYPSQVFETRDGEMVQHLRALAALPENAGSVLVIKPIWWLIIVSTFISSTSNTLF